MPRTRARAGSIVGWGGSLRTLRLPKVQMGGKDKLPESRSEVIFKILDRLTGAGAPEAIRQEYSNGEFITSSLIIGTTLAAVSDRKHDLDGAGHTAYFDPDLGLWWRRGGCFD